MEGDAVLGDGGGWGRWAVDSDAGEVGGCDEMVDGPGVMIGEEGAGVSSSSSTAGDGRVGLGGEVVPPSIRPGPTTCA